MKLRNHDKQVKKNKNVQNFTSLTAAAATLTAATITTATVTTDNVVTATVNSGSFTGMLKVPIKPTVTSSSTAAPFWVSGDRGYFFLRIKGTVKSGALK